MFVAEDKIQGTVCLMSMPLQLTYAVAFLAFIQTAVALQCYRCVSSQPGCGKELSIRLERWHTCPPPDQYGGENFCVKVIEQVGSDVVITRECLMILRHSTRHREKLPTVQRQNYCQPGRNNDPKNPYDFSKTFCFCNDKDGCNNAPKQMTTMLTPFVISALVMCYKVLLY